MAIDADHNHGVERRSGAEKAHHVAVPSFRPDPVEQVDEDEADQRLVQTVEHPHGDLGDAEVEVLLALQEEKQRDRSRFCGRMLWVGRGGAKIVVLLALQEAKEMGNFTVCGQML